MNYIDAFKVHGIVEEIEQNNKDIRIFKEAIQSGIEGVQIQIKCKDGTFMSTVYENDRINLLAQTLYARNTELLNKLKEL